MSLLAAKARAGVPVSLLVHQLVLEHNLAEPFSIDEKSSTLTDLI